MTTAGDASRGIRENFQINEKPQNVRRDGGQISSSGVSDLSTHQGEDIASVGISELEQILIQKTFSRAERQRLIALLHLEESSSNDKRMPSLSRLEASTTSGSHKKPKLGDERDNFHASVIISNEVIASPAELAKAYKGSTSTIVQAPRQDLKLINDNAKTSVTSPQHLATMEDLPDELLLNICIRLLAKQLAQMRSVSKSWNALLSQSSFIKSHLHHSIYNKSQIVLVSYDIDGTPSDFEPVTARPCQSPQHPSSIELPVSPRPRPGYRKGFRVIGCVNGLICSCYGDSVIQIWNPSLSTVLTLPPYSVPRADKSIRIYCRFGFDPKTEDYKVVKLTRLTRRPQPPYLDIWWLHVEMYSMRKGTWELITGRFPSHITRITPDLYACFDGHDGHLHWLGYTRKKGDPGIIVAFDLGSETFREMLLPDSILGGNCNHLGVLAKKLCVLSHVPPRASAHAFEIWVMEEYGVAESWVKRHVFSHFIGDIRPFGFTSCSEFLIVINGRIVLYDPIAKRETILKNYGPALYDPHNILEYVESLVWVAPAQ